MPLEAQHFWERVTEAFGTTKIAEIAPKLSLEVQALYKWQAGTIPKIDTLIKISDSTGSSIHWLLTGQGPKMVEEASSPTDRQLIQDIISLMGPDFMDDLNRGAHAGDVLRTVIRREIEKVIVDLPENLRVPVLDQKRAPESLKRTKEGAKNESGQSADDTHTRTR